MARRELREDSRQARDGHGHLPAPGRRRYEPERAMLALLSGTKTGRVNSVWGEPRRRST